MNQLCVLFVVDTEAALATSSLAGNVCAVDTNGYLGSWQEGTSQLHTLCEEGQVVVWSVTGISPDARVTITGFTGAMVDQKVCVPALSPYDDGAWLARVESRGVSASFGYTATLSLSGAELPFSCNLKVVAQF